MSMHFKQEEFIPTFAILLDPEGLKTIPISITVVKDLICSVALADSGSLRARGKNDLKASSSFWSNSFVQENEHEDLCAFYGCIYP